MLRWCGLLALTATTTVLAGPLRAQPAGADPVIVILPTPLQSNAAALDGLAYDNLWTAKRTVREWSGNAATCSPGALSQANYDVALRSLNTTRLVEGLDPVVLDAAKSAKAQAAALILKATRQLSHYPPPTAACYTPQGADGASHSNICFCSELSMLMYMNDAGTSNEAAGHRRWILDPFIDSMGYGATDSTDAVYVIGDEDQTNTAPAWITWPLAWIAWVIDWATELTPAIAPVPSRMQRMKI